MLQILVALREDLVNIMYTTKSIYNSTKPDSMVFQTERTKKKPFKMLPFFPGVT